MSRRYADHATARRAALTAGVWVPLAVILLGEAAMIAAGLSGPEEIVTHWGPNGPDRTGPWWEFAITVAAVDIPVLAFFAVFILRARRFSGMGRWLAPVSLGITVMHTLGLGVGVVVLSGSSLVPTATIVGGFAIGILAAIIVGFALPRESPATSAPPATAIPLGLGEVVAWSGSVRLPVAFVASIAAIAIAFIVLAIVLVTVADRHALWLFVVPVPILLALGTTFDWSVAVGPTGVTIRSAIGWPRMRIPVDDIVSAGVTEVDPVSDFGGWGPRWVVRNGKGRWGFVSRRGPALEITRRDGRSVVATVDDAATAAAVLEAYAGAASGGGVA